MISTDAFESCVPGEHFINERCFDEDFAVWLLERLTERTLEISEPIQEDWGWALLASRSDHTFVVSIGAMDESIGNSPADWRISVAHERGSNRLFRLFRKPDPAVFAEVCAELAAIFTADPRFDVREKAVPPVRR